MANFNTATGQLNNNDLIYYPLNVGVPTTALRLDQYILTLDQPPASLTLRLESTSNGNFGIAAVNPNNGIEILGSFDYGTAPVSNVPLVPGQTSYRVVLVSDEPPAAFPLSYKLQAEADTANVTLTELTASVAGAPQSGNTLSLNGQLTQGDLLVVTATDREWSLADEYRVVPTFSGETLTAQVSQAIGFNPRLQIINATAGTVIDSVLGVGTTATEPLLAGNEYRVRVFNNEKLGEEDTRNYTLALNVPNGLSVAELRSVEGFGQVNTNTPTPTPAPPPVAANAAEYASYNKGTNGSAQNPDPNGVYNDFNLIGLSNGDDTIDLNVVPNLGTPPIFTDLRPGINLDGSENYQDGRWVVALGGNDTFIGTAGNDVPIAGNTGNDIFNMGAGDDVAVGGAGDDLINGGDGNDVLNGNPGSDRVNGDNGNDILNGGAGDDQIDGGAGKDRLQGDGGRDFLTGGANDDTFVLHSNSATGNLAEVDVITDFQIAEADKIELVGATFADVTLDATDMAIDGGVSVASTAIKLAASGQYIGLVQGVTPYDLAAASGSVFV
ncbi:hypothetical protein AY599_21875 [Leptolyngbya valderiana BDU 20041]|nr:hypothetical protein AY599_21875 [Leptolyngbya valderiana BDU 20041]